MPLKHTSVPTRRRRRAVRRIDEQPCAVCYGSICSDVWRWRRGVRRTLEGKSVLHRVSSVIGFTWTVKTLGGARVANLAHYEITILSSFPAHRAATLYRTRVLNLATDLPPLGGGGTRFRGRGDAISGVRREDADVVLLVRDARVFVGRYFVSSLNWEPSLKRGREELSRAANNRWPIRYSKLKTTSRCKNK